MLWGFSLVKLVQGKYFGSFDKEILIPILARWIYVKGRKVKMMKVGSGFNCWGVKNVLEVPYILFNLILYLFSFFFLYRLKKETVLGSFYWRQSRSE